MRGRAVAFQLATGTIGDDRTLPLSLDTSVGGDSGNALLEGTVSGIDGTPSFAGTMRAQGSDLGAMLAALDLELAAVPAAPLANAFSAKGALSADANEIAVRDIQLRLGESQAGGTLSWRDGDAPLLDAKLALNRIDLDQYLPADGGAGAAPPAGDAEQAATAPALDFLGTVPAHIRQMIPGDMGADVDLSIDALTWRRGVIRQAKAQLAVDDGAVTIQHASALLPGGAKVDLAGRLPAAGDGPWLEGTAEVAADDLRAVLSWLALDTGAVPADRLRRLDASLDFSAQGTRLTTSNLDVRVDTTRIAGDAFVETGERPRLAARLAADAVNVDAYLLADGAEGGAQNASQAAEARPGDGVRAALAGMDADVALRMDSLIYGGVRLTGLEFGGTVADGDLTLHRASVADVLGASVSMTGTRVPSGPCRPSRSRSKARPIRSRASPRCSRSIPTSAPSRSARSRCRARRRAARKRSRSTSPFPRAAPRPRWPARSRRRSARPPPRSPSTSVPPMPPRSPAPWASRRRPSSHGWERWRSTAGSAAIPNRSR